VSDNLRVTLSLSQCAKPKLGARRWSTYTVLGFLGYGVASVFCAVLASRWEFTLSMRLVSLVAPPIAFIVVVTIATAIKGHELIVFYQTTVAGVASVALLGLATGGSVWRQLDVAVLGIGVFLAFGRLGCFHVACCHGRLAKRGVAYGDAHVAVGFWKRWRGRTLVPVQLIESACSAALVVVGLLVSTEPGRAAIAYGAGYAVLRFVLELYRGDPVRPLARGLSEAQWFANVTAIGCAVAWPAWWTLAAALSVVGASVVLVRVRVRRELHLPQHLREIDRVCEEVSADPAHARRETSLGVGISSHVLPDGRVDWIMSSTTHPSWSAATARRIANALWLDTEIVEGRTAGVIHIVVARD
jgi:Prolipoprotein diacylglyceryl transferase